MSFCLHRKESVADGWHRLVEEEFEAVETALLALSEETARPDAVHTARRHLKKLRALCQLWRERLGPELCAQEKAILRDVARDLSAMRDLEVKVAKLNLVLQPHHLLAKHAAVRHILHAWMAERDRLLEETSRPEAQLCLVKTLRAARKRFALLPAQHGGRELMTGALSHSYRRARKGLAAFHEQPVADELCHEWRKRVKVIEYQLTVLRKMHRSAAAHTRQLHALTECLGDEHDLADLTAGLHERHSNFLRTPDGAQVLALIEESRARHRRRALKLGRKMFAEKTKHFVEKLNAWWDAWK